MTKRLAELLDKLDSRVVIRRSVHPAEVPDRVALHLGRLVEQVLRSVAIDERATRGSAAVDGVLDALAEIASAGMSLDGDRLGGAVEVLTAITTLLPDSTARTIDEPLIPLLDTTLLTNAPNEPRVGHQIAAEIGSAQRIDVLMAFIRLSGINPLIERIREHCQRGGTIRVLTTTYTGSTQRIALDRLVEAGANVRVSYDVSTTRLHAKSWLFHRESGFSTAYIGSSNLTHSAQQAGLEWNVRASAARNPDVIDKVAAVFESYWSSKDFVAFDPTEFDEQTAQTQSSGPAVYLSPLAVTPLPFQERMLELLALERTKARHRNLLVSATGTGKTVMAALDYARLRITLGRSRLLFVAHRQEILDQSQATFRHVLRDPGFGEQWIGGRRPSEFEHVFASVQSLAKADLGIFDPAHFDVVIVDEFHHAAAPSYERLLRNVQPVELLGLTATPERADGTSVLTWFDDRIAAELRLWDAIDQHYLTPFAYYGIYDGLDLTDVPWRRGRGYDADGLSALYTANDLWATNVLKELIRHVGDVGGSRCLAFCVSVDHARFMARVFSQAGVRAVAVWGATPESERRSALRLLRDGKINVVFSVDLFNEGVDVPRVDTLLLLRPTDSPVLFLQQLGRGLRKEQDKPVCTVLDFVGEHRREFRFDCRFRSLLGGSRKELAATVEAGFPYLPAGCHMELDRKTSEIVLRSIRTSLPSKWPQKIEELRSLANSASGNVTLVEFLDHSGLELEDVYDGGKCWSDLRSAAGLAVLPAGPHEATLRKSLSRLLHTDDVERLEAWSEVVEPLAHPTRSLPSEITNRRCRMLVHQMLDQLANGVISRGTSLATGIALVRGHPQVCSEIAELTVLLRDRIGHIHPAGLILGSPLVVHARYTRLEIVAALGIGEGARNGRPWREGVMYLPDVPADVFAITLDKTGAGFSPTTRYRDYAISPTLIHWESQSTTPAESPTGQRYQHHTERGSSVLMFARLNAADRAFWFLGPATYVRHSGERPMAITWQLEHPLPGDLFVQFAAAIA